RAARRDLTGRVGLADREQWGEQGIGAEERVLFDREVGGPGEPHLGEVEGDAVAAVAASDGDEGARLELALEHVEAADHLPRTVRFSNENLKVKIEENVREQDVFLVQPSCPPVSEGIVELLILLDALKSASARRVTAVLPYYPYARSDKKDEPRISITARLMADLVATAGANRVLTIDLHSPQIQGFFSMPADQLTAVPVLCERLRADGLEEAIVVAADVGEAKDAAVFAKHLGLPIAIIDKRRSGAEELAEAVAVIGDVRGKRCLLVDDEI